MSIENKQNFAKRFKEARETLGLTRVEFRESIGISATYLSEIEHGKKIPSLKILRKIENIHKINRRWLETGVGEMFLPDQAGPHVISEQLDKIRDSYQSRADGSLLFELAELRAEQAEEIMLSNIPDAIWLEQKIKELYTKLRQYRRGENSLQTGTDPHGR